jgi:cupin 2 domain-containing protein
MIGISIPRSSETLVRTAGVSHTGQDDPVAEDPRRGTARRGTLGTGDAPPGGERFVEVARAGGAVVEEIVSSATPDTGLQVQDHDEWVVLLAGRAELDIGGEEHTLGPNDWVLLPAHTPHRGVRTEPGSRWLAVHGPATTA